MHKCTHSMRKLSTDKTDDEWVMQQTMAMRAMEQVCIYTYNNRHNNT
jgi:hypothetical protein